MNIYLIWRETDGGYDTFDSAVVVAPHGEAARLIHPRGGENNERKGDRYSSWVPADEVNFDLIGKASPEMKAGVVLASFNAG